MTSPGLWEHFPWRQFTVILTISVNVPYMCLQQCGSLQKRNFFFSFLSLIREFPDLSATRPLNFPTFRHLNHMSLTFSLTSGDHEHAPQMQVCFFFFFLLIKFRRNWITINWTSLKTEKCSESGHVFQTKLISVFVHVHFRIADSIRHLTLHAILLISTYGKLLQPAPCNYCECLVMSSFLYKSWATLIFSFSI